jgi:magnesium-protoporphyrin IX monomethyl ester (oxidative) cyclase
MYVRDHARPEFHKALGVDIEWYDQEVFRKTSTIAKQVFPLELDIDHPRWLPNRRKMEVAFRKMDDGTKKGGLSGRLTKWAGTTQAALAFASLYLIPVRKSTPPASVRLEPIY